jgi:competence protein ComEC
MGKDQKKLKNQKALYKWSIFLGVILWIAFFMVGMFCEQVWDRNAKVSFLDIGQGDASLIRTANGATILVDGGKNARLLLERLSDKLGYFDRSLEMVVLTHPDNDHFGGLLEVLEFYEVKSVLITGIKDEENESYQKLLEVISQKSPNTVVVPALSGEEIKVDGVTLSVLYPEEILWGKEVKDSNATSIVIFAQVKGKGYLLTGDADKAIEERLVAKYPHLEVDVLKVGHHGSKTSTSAKMLEAWRPEYGVISAGENNSFGHPHQEVLDLLGQYGIKIFVTSIDKTIDF